MNTFEINIIRVNNFRIFAKCFVLGFIGTLICLTGVALMNTFEIKYNNVNNFRIFAKS